MSGAKCEPVKCEVQPKTFLIQHTIRRIIRKMNFKNTYFDDKSQNH